MYVLTITKLAPWTELNEHEGEIHGLIAGRPVCCYVFFPDGKKWLQYKPGENHRVDISLERGGGKTFSRSRQAEARLRQIGNSHYHVVGKVIQKVSEEIFIVESLFELRVDLDFLASENQKSPSVGEWIQVEGVLKADFQ